MARGERPTHLPLELHPTALAARSRDAPLPAPLTLAQVREIALAAGADDAAAVPIDHPDLVGERPHAEHALPGTRWVVSLVLRMHPDDVRSPARSVANVEFHRTGTEMNEVARRVAVALAARGHRAINPAMAFPLEMASFPDRVWVISHKTVAVAAQLGRMGIHRNVIHPKFGSFVALGTVLTTAEIQGEPPALSFDPCLGCRLCVAACPVGAIGSDGTFRFSACYDHNYRDFLSGFADFAEEIAESSGRHALRERVSQAEAATLWQNLAHGPTYNAAYCLAVCPAGEEVIRPWLESKAQHLSAVVKPLTERQEVVYVVAGSDAEAHVRGRFPHKKVRIVRSSLRPTDAASFFRVLPLVFQPGRARGWSATFHFQLTGAPAAEGTVHIRDGTLQIEEGLVGDPDVVVRCPGPTWIDIVTRKRGPVFAVLTGRLKITGDRALLDKFTACFPR